MRLEHYAPGPPRGKTKLDRVDHVASGPAGGWFQCSSVHSLGPLLLRVVLLVVAPVTHSMGGPHQLTAQQCEHMETQGFVVLPSLVPASTVNLLLECVDKVQAETSTGFASGWPRFADSSPEYSVVAQMYSFRPILARVEQLIGGPAQCTGGEMLDKAAVAPKDHPGTAVAGHRGNWDIQWHQDTGIYVDALSPEDPPRHRLEGPPPVYNTTNNELSRNVSVRVALDDQPAVKGPLCVYPASHTQHHDREQWRKQYSDDHGVMIEQASGDVLFYRPLTMHRSDRVADGTPGQRRTLYLHFGPLDLRLPIRTNHAETMLYSEQSPWAHCTTLPIPLTPRDDVAGTSRGGAAAQQVRVAGAPSSTPCYGSVQTEAATHATFARHLLNPQLAVHAWRRRARQLDQAT